MALGPDDEGLGSIRPRSSPSNRRAGPPQSDVMHGSVADAGTSSPAEAVIWTVGHGTRSTDGLAGFLAAAGATTVIDVRRYPAGRRQPRFARQRLEADLPARGISYEWWGEALGGRRQMPSPPPTKSPGRSHGFIASAAHMHSQSRSGPESAVPNS
jgi:hypothetical protein